MKEKKLNVRCFRLDGTEVSLNADKTGFDPPLTPPRELERKILDRLNRMAIQKDKEEREQEALRRIEQ